MKIVNSLIPKTAIENPVGIMSNIYRKPDQIIQPYFFGDEAQKTTCLWLKGLPKLFHVKTPDLFNNNPTHTKKGEFYVSPSGKKMPLWYSKASGDGRKRSKTFPGFATEMANQWG